MSRLRKGGSFMQRVVRFVVICAGMTCRSTLGDPAPADRSGHAALGQELTLNVECPCEHLQESEAGLRKEPKEALEARMLAGNDQRLVVFPAAQQVGAVQADVGQDLVGDLIARSTGAEGS